MTGFLPNNGWKGVPYPVPSQQNTWKGVPYRAPQPQKRSYSVDDAMRRNRILPTGQCRDNLSKLANLRRLIAAAEREYRETAAELDRLNSEGRVWLVVDIIHKTSLAALDLGASLMQAFGLKTGDTVRKLSDVTQTISDAQTGLAGVANGSVSGTEFVQTAAQRTLTHIEAKGAGGTLAKGTVSTALDGWSSLDKITAAQGTPSTSARTTEAGVELAANLVQRTADTLDSGTQGGHAVAKRISATAQIAKAMASYNRELEAAFDRNLEISGNLMARKATMRATLDRTISRYRRDAAEIEKQLQGCF